MRKGFTILELLVASLLLGMLMTILTMIFNQSSIAWRTGMASSVDMDKVRENIAEVREEADNAFVHAGELHRILGLWDDTKSQLTFRKRACDAGGENQTKNKPGLLENKASYLKNSGVTVNDFIPVLVGMSEGGNLGQQASGGGGNYTVNVKSSGPNGTPNDWDDVWSWPDEWE